MSAQHATVPVVRAARDVQGADAAMTAERDEVKYLVPAPRVRPFAQTMMRHLPEHRFTGEGANRLPNPRNFVTTIYFDTPSRHQYHAAQLDTQHNLKMRAKEYYDMHPSLAELATDPRQIVKFTPVLWLELKFKDHTKTGKRRIGIPKAQIPAFFTQGTITPEMVDLQRDNFGAESETVLCEIAAYCGKYQEPFQADCLVNYRRISWQDATGGLRVTLDMGLEFYAPPPDLWQRKYALVRETLGQARGRLAEGVLEVKTRGAPPDWLRRLLDEAQATRDCFSKFETASEAVHGQKA
jgi:hypothetical protein